MTAIGNQIFLRTNIPLGLIATKLCHFALPLAKTDTDRHTIYYVKVLCEQNSSDLTSWKFAVDYLSKLVHKHPDAHKESGGYFDGASDLLALAIAREIALHAVSVIEWGNTTEEKIQQEREAHAYKAYYYLLSAYAKNPEITKESYVQLTNFLLSVFRGP